MTHVALSLAGSSTGLLIAVGIARLFQWLRRAAPDTVSNAGNGIGILTGCFGICFFVLAPVLLLPHLVCAAIAGCQSRQPARFPLSWIQLLGITVIEVLVAVFAGWWLTTVTGGGGGAEMRAGKEFVAAATLALGVVLLLLETVGPPRSGGGHFPNGGAIQ